MLKVYNESTPTEEGPKGLTNRSSNNVNRASAVITLETIEQSANQQDEETREEKEEDDDLDQSYSFADGDSAE